MRLKFHQRTVGQGQEPEVVTKVLSSVPFRDIGWDPNRRPPDLAGQSKSLMLWETFRDAVTLHHEIHGLLPDQQIPVTPDHKISIYH